MSQGEAAYVASKAPASDVATVPTLHQFAPDWLDKHLLANLRKRSTYVTAKMVLDLHLLPTRDRH